VGSIGQNFWKNIKVEKLKDEKKLENLKLGMDHNSNNDKDNTKKHEISTKLEEFFDDAYYDNLENEEKVLREQEEVCI
jgi:hypothetical protein